MEPNINQTPNPGNSSGNNNLTLSKPKTNLLTITILVLVILLVSAGSFVLGKYFTGNKNEPVLPPTPIVQQPTVIPTTDPTADWKTYTNTKNGYEFRYPSNIFVYQRKENNGTQYWSNKINGDSPITLGVDGLWLTSTFYDSNVNLLQSIDVINLKVGESLPEQAITKLSVFFTNGEKGTLYYHGVPPNFTGEGAYSYSAEWEAKGNNLALSAVTKENLTKYKNTFDQILSTFKFIE